ncbi:uncharacterized protein [Montipora foliosa]|uniref:uncharacterized protein n=1 Tax=Montipora foliosa TaxID=591990 RepID=UPI0035F1F2A4
MTTYLFLSTSIPVDVAISVAHNRLISDENLQDRTAIPIPDIIKLLDFCLSTTNFQYDHKHYKQIHGTAMGSPVSAIMENMVMEDIEERALASLTNPPLFWKRFVDDVITTAKSVSTQTLLEHLNSVEPCILFTIERENLSKIAFLDTMVHHQEDEKLITTVYRKPTHTDGYLSYLSHHPSMHKRAGVKSLMDRAERIPSTKSDQNKEKQRIMSTLQSNGYPKLFILSASKPKPPLNHPLTDAESEGKYCTIPYVSGTSEPIKRVLDNHGIKVTFNPTRQLGRYFQSRKTKWTKKKFEISCMTSPAQFVVRITSEKRKENLQLEKASIKRPSHGYKKKNQHLRTTL